MDRPRDDYPIEQYEHDIGLDHGTHVMYHGRRTLVHNEIMTRLQLVAEQNVSSVIMLEILGRTVLLHERDAVEAAKKDGASGPTRKKWPTYKREYSDRRLMEMGQDERDMDCGTKPFVRVGKDRVPLTPMEMAELSLENGQPLNEVIAQQILWRRERHKTRTPGGRRLIRQDS